MKITLSLLLLLFINNLFSQEINAKLSNALPNEYIYHNQSFFHKGKLYFFENEMSFKERKIILNTENDQVLDLEQKKLEVDGYIVSLSQNKKHIKDDHLYELVYCSNKKKLTNFGYAVLKRNLNTISEVEKTVWLETFDVSPSVSSIINTWLYPGNNCFYIVRQAYVGKNGEQNYIAKYNYNLEQIWKKDFSFTNENGITIDKVTVNENDDLLVALKIKGDTKGGWFKSIVVQSGLFFYIIKNNGEELRFSPQIDQNMVINECKFRYYPEKEEVVGLFMVNKLYDKDYSTYDNGYVYMKWDNEGSLLTSNTHYFTWEELKNSELDKYLLANKKDYKKEYFDKKGNMKTISYYFNIQFLDNQDAVVGCGNLLYKVNSEGQLGWVNFSVGDIIGQIVVKDDIVYTCNSDFSENYTSGQYAPYSKAKTAIVSAKKLDFKTGELQSIQPVKNIPKDYLLRGAIVDKESNSYFVEYRNTKKNSRKIVSFSL